MIGHGTSKFAVGGGCDCFCLVVGPRARGKGSEDTWVIKHLPPTVKIWKCSLENIFPDIRDTGGYWALGELQSKLARTPILDHKVSVLWFHIFSKIVPSASSSLLYSSEMLFPSSCDLVDTWKPKAAEREGLLPGNTRAGVVGRLET